MRDTRSPPGEPRPDTRWETRAGFGSVWAVRKRRLFCSLSASARMRPHPPRQRNGLGLVRALCRRWCGPPMATGSARAPRPRRPRAWLRVAAREWPSPVLSNPRRLRPSANQERDGAQGGAPTPRCPCTGLIGHTGRAPLAPAWGHRRRLAKKNCVLVDRKIYAAHKAASSSLAAVSSRRR